MAALSSPPDSSSRRRRYITPALTLSVAEAGSSFWPPARFCWTKSHVPGMTCITPRALAPDTMALLNPLSCHATAAASDGETPYCAAIDWTSAAPRRVGVGAGFAAGTTCVAGAGPAARGGVGEPLGSLITV